MEIFVELSLKLLRLYEIVYKKFKTKMFKRKLIEIHKKQQLE